MHAGDGTEVVVTEQNAAELAESGSRFAGSGGVVLAPVATEASQGKKDRKTLNTLTIAAVVVGSVCVLLCAAGVPTMVWHSRRQRRWLAGAQEASAAKELRGGAVGTDSSFYESRIACVPGMEGSVGSAAGEIVSTVRSDLHCEVRDLPVSYQINTKDQEQLSVRGDGRPHQEGAQWGGDCMQQPGGAGSLSACEGASMEGERSGKVNSHRIMPSPMHFLLISPLMISQW